ncbi:MAG: hypothetical protein J5710_03540 [Treponema sp.]|nr:hypothetical protein [Treponema sp.]MBR5645186.1 hypothetical protein [Treponema sp.]
MYEPTHNGCDLIYKDWIVGLNKGYRENGKYVTTDNFIVTSFKRNEEKETNDTIAYAATFTPDTNRSENLLSDEIIIHSAPKVKLSFEVDDPSKIAGRYTQLCISLYISKSAFTPLILHYLM